MSRTQRAALGVVLGLAACAAPPAHHHPADAPTADATGAPDDRAETGCAAGASAASVAAFALLERECGTSCHAARTANAGLVLGPLCDVGAATVRAGLVGTRSQNVDMLLVEPGDPERSWLLRKVQGRFAEVACAGGCGARMPPAGQGLAEAEVEVLRAWIAAGARP